MAYSAFTNAYQETSFLFGDFVSFFFCLSELALANEFSGKNLAEKEQPGAAPLSVVCVRRVNFKLECSFSLNLGIGIKIFGSRAYQITPNSSETFKIQCQSMHIRLFDLLTSLGWWTKSGCKLQLLVYAEFELSKLTPKPYWYTSPFSC